MPTKITLCGVTLPEIVAINHPTDMLDPGTPGQAGGIAVAPNTTTPIANSLIPSLITTNVECGTYTVTILSVTGPGLGSIADVVYTGDGAGTNSFDVTTLVGDWLFEYQACCVLDGAVCDSGYIAGTTI